MRLIWNANRTNFLKRPAKCLRLAHGKELPHFPGFDPMSKIKLTVVGMKNEEGRLGDRRKRRGLQQQAARLGRADDDAFRLWEEDAPQIARPPVTKSVRRSNRAAQSRRQAVNHCDLTDRVNGIRCKFS